MFWYIKIVFKNIRFFSECLVEVYHKLHILAELFVTLRKKIAQNLKAEKQVIFQFFAIFSN